MSKNMQGQPYHKNNVLNSTNSKTNIDKEKTTRYAPEAVLDDFQSATDILATEGLIVRSKNNLSFFHESFFDYIFARAFTTGEQSLLELLTSTETTPFPPHSNTTDFRSTKAG